MVLYTECVEARGMHRTTRMSGYAAASQGWVPGTELLPGIQLYAVIRRRTCATSGTIERLQWSLRWHLPS